MKTCLKCSSPVFSKGLCYYHRERKAIVRKTYAQVTLKQTEDGLKAKVFKIRPVSKSRQDALKRYRRLRDKYFEDNPVCEYPLCTSKKITLHHKRGRIGAFLTDKRHFCSLCIKHHDWVEKNPLEAQRLGLSEKRLTI